MALNNWFSRSLVLLLHPLLLPEQHLDKELEFLAELVREERGGHVVLTDGVYLTLHFEISRFYVHVVSLVNLFKDLLAFKRLLCDILVD